MMKMPNLGLGTFRLKDQPLRDSLLQGLELGYRHIDTAQIYDNEAEVGQLMSESGVPRQDIYLTTKVWTSEFGPGKVIPSLEVSLEKLGTDYLDLALIHWPSPQDEVPMAVYLAQLAEEVLEIEILARGDLPGKLFGVRAVDLAGDLLDQRQHVAHA